MASDKISKVITSLDPTKKTSVVIRMKTVELANKEIFKDLANSISKWMIKKEFPNELKVACITPTLKKADPLKKENYGSVS